MQNISCFNQAAIDYAVFAISAVFPASLRGSIMKVISDEETVWLSLSPVVQLFPRLSDGERGCCADPLSPPSSSPYGFIVSGE